MGQTLAELWNDMTVTVITNDGKVIVGTMKGLDKTSNIILDDSHERVFSIDSGVEKHHHGLIILRGENVALIGETDRDEDVKIDFDNIKAEPLKTIATRGSK